MGRQQAKEFMRGTVGLNTRLDPERIQQGSRDNGYTIELARAANISIDDRGLASLRWGYGDGVEGDFHSLFCDGGDCFAVQERESDAAIVRVTSVSPLTIAPAPVRTGLTKNKRMGWCQVNYDTFYGNGVQNGYIRSGANYAWPVGSYTGPTIDAQFEASAPVAEHIAVVPWMQMALAVGPVVFLNHGPPSFQFGLYSKRMGAIGFDSNITMLCSVQAGFFASDSNRTWLLRKVGEGWYDYRQELVEDAPAIVGRLAHGRVRLKSMGIEAEGFARVWVSKKGVCFGLDDGTFINRTEGTVDGPNGSTLGACLITLDRVISTGD